MTEERFVGLTYIDAVSACSSCRGSMMKHPAVREAPLMTAV